MSEENTKTIKISKTLFFSFERVKRKKKEIQNIESID